MGSDSDTSVRASAETATSPAVLPETPRSQDVSDQPTVAQILDAVPHPVFWKDCSGAYLGCNELFAHTAGLRNAAEIVGKTDFDLPWPRAEAEAYRANDRQVIESRQPRRHIVEPMQRADGTRLWVDTTKVPLVAPDGQVYGVLGVFDDITGRRQAEEALAETQALLTAAVEQTPAGIIIADAPGGRIRIANAAASAIQGAGREQPSGVPVDLHRRSWQMFWPDGTPVATEDFPLSRAFLRGETSRNVDLIVRRPTGEDRWTLANAAPVRNARGEVVAGIVVFADVTERKRAEDRIQGLNRLKEELLGDGDLDAKLRRVTDGVVDIFEADFARIWLSRPGDLCAAGCVHAGVRDGPHVCQRRDRCLHLVASSGRYTHLDGQTHRRVPFGCYKIGRIASGDEPAFLTNAVGDDPRVHDHEWAQRLGLVSFAGYRLLSASQEPIGVLALFSRHPLSTQDDTLLASVAATTSHVILAARAQESLRASEERWQFALEGAGDGVWDWNTQTNEVFFSPQWKAMLGYAEHEIGTNLTEWESRVHPEDLPQAEADLQRHLSGQTATYVNEHRMRCKDGSWKWILDRGKVVSRTAGGRPLRVVGTHTDLTERKRAEEALQFNESRLEALLRLNQMADATLTDIAEFAMEEAVRLTRSQLGYIAFASEDESVLTMFAWSKAAMQVCAVEDRTIVYPVATTGLWGEAVRQRRPIITNDYAAPNPWKHGTPAGHVPVQRHMNVPVFDGDRIVIVAGVGNKETDYDESDVRQLTLLMSGMWRIVQRKRAEEELQKLAAVVRHSSELVNLATLDGQMVFLNAAGSRMLGVEPSAVGQRTILDVIPDEWHALVQNEVLPALRAGNTWEGELAYRNLQTGALTDVHAMVFSVRDPRTGAPQYLANVSLDVGERKRAEQALRDSEALMQSIFRAAPVAIGIVDPDRKIRSINDCILKILGYRPDEIIGQNTRKFYFTEEDYQLAGRASQQPHPQFGIVRSEHHMRHKDGGEVHVIVNQAPLRWGEPGAGSVFTLMDITERKRAEQALQSRIVAMTRPLDDASTITFSDLFDVDEIQKIQDMFAKSTGVASIITHPDGTPITKPSNFCRLCSAIIRKTTQGLCNCYRSDAIIGRYNPRGPIVQPCLSGGLWDAGASITVGGKHVANWLIGQVQNERLDPERMLQYADQIGVDREEFRAALAEVPVMSEEQFKTVADTLFLLANELSIKAYQNVQQARFIADLKRTEEERDRLFNLSIDMLCVAGFDGHFKQVNPAWTRTLGWSAEELTKPAWLDLVHPDDMAATIAAGDRLRRGEEVRSFENRYRCKDGTYRWLSWNSYPLMAQELIFAVCRDVTDGKRTEEALNESLARFTSFAEATRYGFGMANLDATITYVNTALADMLGEAHPHDAVGRKFLAYYPPDSAEKLKTEVLPVLMDKGHWQGELELLTRDGRKVPVDENYFVIHDPEGRPRYIGDILTDITERKIAEEERAKLEAQLRQSQKMEAIGQLAGGVAHDFNNILTAIFGNVELATTALQAELSTPPKAFAGLQQIERSAQRASTLTRQLLAFSRRQLVQPEVLNLNATLRDLEKMLHRLLAENITLEQNLAEDLAPTKADAGQLEQVVMNLVVNARDAMPNGGRLTLETQNVVLDEAYVELHPGARPGAQVVLTVSDTGHGMDRATLEHIFEPFFTTKPKEQGTGLGLSTVYGIVKQAGGHVTVYSEPGIGTSFKVYLPAVHEPVSVAKPVRPAVGPSGAETLIICEDDPAVRELTAQILARHGYTVLVAEDGQRALHLAGEHSGPIHLLVTDVIMPGMNGRQLSEALAAARPGIRTLFVSGYTSNVIAHHGVLDEHVNFLGKPYSRQQLLEKVREVLETACPAEPAVPPDAARA